MKYRTEPVGLGLVSVDPVRIKFYAHPSFKLENRINQEEASSLSLRKTKALSITFKHGGIRADFNILEYEAHRRGGFGAVNRRSSYKRETRRVKADWVEFGQLG